MNLGLIRAGVWLPQGFEDSKSISEQSGLPEKVVREKMGIVRKCRASKDEHPSMMALQAAKKVLRDDIDPLSIDLVIWTGSEYKDYPVWSAGIFVQRELGLKNAWAFDASARCSSNVLGLHLAKSLAQSDKRIKRVLLCGGHKTGDLVNYQDESSRFLYNLSDGGSAMLLEVGDVNPILSSSFITDGDFSLDVIIKAGGTRSPTRNHPKGIDTYLTCPDIEGMRDRLATSSIKNFLQVIKESAQNSMERPIDYLALLHMKKSAHDGILQGMDLREDQSIYLDHYGHFGAPDQVLSLGLAEYQEKLMPGSHVSLASAGIGYTWSAISLRWDRPIFAPNDFEVLN